MSPKFGYDFYPTTALKICTVLNGIEDNGSDLAFNDIVLKLLPAHFLHSPGQLNVYDPLSKILFTGDIGAAEYQNVDLSEVFVNDFTEHQRHIEYFHRRYMTSNRALRYWLKTIKPYDINLIAPQHGYLYRNKAKAGLLNWLETLECGSDLLDID